MQRDKIPLDTLCASSSLHLLILSNYPPDSILVPNISRSYTTNPNAIQAESTTPTPALKVARRNAEDRQDRNQHLPFLQQLKETDTSTPSGPPARPLPFPPIGANRFESQEVSEKAHDDQRLGEKKKSQDKLSALEKKKSEGKLLMEKKKSEEKMSAEKRVDERPRNTLSASSDSHLEWGETPIGRIVTTKTASSAPSTIRSESLPEARENDTRGKEFKESRETKDMKDGKEPKERPQMAIDDSILAKRRQGSILQKISSAFSAKKKTMRKESGTDKEKRQEASEATTETAEDPLEEIKFLSFEELVMALTSSHIDLALQTDVFLTMESFCLPPDLLRALLFRFDNCAGEGALLTQLRCVHVIREWLISHRASWAKYKGALVPILLEFRSKLNQTTHPKILKVFDSLMEAVEAGAFQDRTPSHQTAPPSLLPSKFNRLHVLLIDPLELARQMTLIDQALLIKIEPAELLGGAWMKSDGRDKAPNVTNMIVRFNITSRWIVAEILREESQKTRVSLISHFLSVANHLLQLNNFNGLLEVYCAFETHAVFRLRKTFAALSEADTAMLGKLREICNQAGNHRGLWRLQAEAEKPVLPYLGMYLSALTVISEGSPNSSPDGRINWTKRQQLSKFIGELQTFQKARYNLRSVPILKDYILNAEVFDDDTHYRLSYFLEPRDATPQMRPKEIRHYELERAKDLDQGGRSRSFKILRERLKIQRSSILKTDDVTFEKLIENTIGANLDTKKVSQLLTAYHCLCTSDELLASILERLLTADGSSKAAIQNSCLRVIQLWIEDHWSSFARDAPGLSQLLNDFWSEYQNKEVMNDLKDKFSRLLDLLQEQLYSPPDEASYSPRGPPAPIITKKQASGGVHSLLDMDPLEVARQITLMDHELFCMVRPWECIEKRWNRASRWSDAPNVCAVLEHQKFLKGWAQGELLGERDLAKRRLKLKALIAIMNNLLENRNFSGMFAVVSALSAPPIARLEKTFSSLSKSEKKSLVAAQEIVNDKGHFHFLWSFQNRALTPNVPLLQMYLGSIERVEELHEMFPPQRGMVDSSRLTKIADLLMDLRRSQTEAYPFIRLPQIKAYLHAAPIFEESAIVEISNFLEPSENDPDPKKPIAFLSASERHDLGIFDSDADWAPMFPLDQSNSYQYDPNLKVLRRLEHGRVIVVGATIAQLIEIVTLLPPKSPESTVLLNTYREYCQPVEFLRLLISRWSLPKLKPEVDATRSKAYHEKVVLPVQTRVLLIIEEWIKNHRVDFDKSSSLIDEARLFIEAQVAPLYPEAAQRIRQLFLNPQIILETPPPLVLGPFPNKPVHDCSAIDFNPSEIARQLTLLDHLYFSKLSASDLLQSSPPNADTAFNQFVSWNESLTSAVAADIKQRPADSSFTGRMLTHWAYVVQQLHSLKNWSSLISILRGIREFFDNLDIWKSVPPELVQTLWRLDQTATQSHSLRSAVLQGLESDRCIPSLFPILEEIEYIQQKGQTSPFLFERTKTINFERCSSLSRVIEDSLVKVKARPYHFAEVPIIQKWILHIVKEVQKKERQRRNSTPTSHEEIQILMDYVAEMETIINSLPSHLRGRFSVVARPQVLHRPRALSLSSSDISSPRLSYLKHSESGGGSSRRSSEEEGRSSMPQSPSQVRSGRKSMSIQRPLTGSGSSSSSTTPRGDTGEE